MELDNAPATTETTETATEQAPAETGLADALTQAPSTEEPAELVPPEAPEEQEEPVQYEFSLPEGMELDAELGAQFKEFAAAKKLSNEDAQKLIDMSLALETKRAEAHTQAVTQWAEESRGDKEFGGSKFDENLGVANKALDAFGTPELKSLLKSTGFGNHPEVIRAFVKIGKAVGEDSLVVRGTTTPPAKSKDPVALYPNSKMK